MEILKDWPTSPPVPDPLVTFLDGRIYSFTTEDAKRLLPPEIAPTLYALKEALMSKSREIHGPYQATSKMFPTITRHTSVGNPPERKLIFQFTGLRTCRSTGCTTEAVPNNQGYCVLHSKEAT